MGCGFQKNKDVMGNVSIKLGESRWPVAELCTTFIVLNVNATPEYTHIQAKRNTYMGICEVYRLMYLIWE